MLTGFPGGVQMEQVSDRTGRVPGPIAGPSVESASPRDVREAIGRRILIYSARRTGQIGRNRCRYFCP